MRPSILFPLFANLETLPGIGAKRAEQVAKRIGPSVINLLWHIPTGIIDRSYRPKIAAAQEGRIATLRLTVDRHAPATGRNRPNRVLCHDETGKIALIFFHARGDYLKRILPEKSEVVVSGKIEQYNDQVQMTHPDHIVPIDEEEKILGAEPVYPMVGGLTAKPMQKAIAAALKSLPDLPEWSDASLIKKHSWPTWRHAMEKVHAPASEVDLAPDNPVRQRLAYDELLASQFALALIRQRHVKQGGRALKGDGRLRQKIMDAFPYQLTGDQQAALKEIDADMQNEDRMVRLLQGDVGSGKTIVALLAAAAAIETGAQAAIMAPTEVLADQHVKSITPLCEAAGIRFAKLTGKDKGKARKEILSKLADGGIDLLIGTHALFQKDVEFKDLALAIIDEQHRFGVHQRLKLAGKGGAGTDMLVMTATPIPRTLCLTSYGDMDFSILREKPPGRKEIATRTMSVEKISAVMDGIQRVLQKSQRVYWVCPLVEESEKSDLAAATDRYAMLKARFGDQVALVHGRMTADEKNEVMDGFATGKKTILVATTVIEVGVDVPEAGIMIIEHAERFGLAQLHQLRGRVGRGEHEGSCILLYQAPLSETAHQRLSTIRTSDDGFFIAEQDLKLRGGGEILGTKQSGVPNFSLVDPSFHEELIEIARDDARLFLQKDPTLTTPRGQAVKILLHLFEREKASFLLGSG